MRPLLPLEGGARLAPPPAAGPARPLGAWADAHLLGSEPRPTAGGGDRWLLPAAGCLLVLVSLLRQGLTPPLDSVWAEDGAVFLARALRGVPGSALAEPYAGYLQVLPRGLARLVSLLPPAWWAPVLAVAGAGVTAATGLTVYVATGAHLRSRGLRWTLAAAVVLVPSAGPEVLNNLTYAHWFLVFGAFWVLLWRPTTLGATAWATGFLLVTALSTPVAAVLVPVAAIRAMVGRGRRDLLPVAALGAGLAAQLTVLAPAPVGGTSASGWADPVTGYLLRVVGGVLPGHTVTGLVWAARGPGVLLLLAAALAALLCAVAVRRRTRVGPVSVLAVGASPVLFAAAQLRPAASELVWSPGHVHHLGARYTLVPSLLLISALVLQLDAAPRLPSRWWRAARVGILTLLLVAVVTSFPVRGERDARSWSRELDRAAERCAARAAGEGVGRGARVRIPVSPGGAWSVPVPCGRLGANHGS